MYERVALSYVKPRGNDTVYRKEYFAVASVISFLSYVYDRLGNRIQASKIGSTTSDLNSLVSPWSVRSVSVRVLFALLATLPSNRIHST